ncbi:retrovirus-related pol polyprotein from transposon TNT 1-94 [Tanacetum coccineum]
MKEVFEQMEAEVDQHVIDKKCDEIERKNLLIENENLIADCLSKDVFYTATDSVLTLSRFSDMHDAFTAAQKHIAKLESENSNLKNKIQNDDHDVMIKHFSKLEVEHLNLQLKYQHLKERFGNKKSVTCSDAPTFESVFVIGQLQEQVQNRGNTIRELKEKISRLTKKHSDADPILDLKALDTQNKDLNAKVNALHDLNERFQAENEKVKQHYKELYDSIKITRAQTIEKTNSLLTEIANLKAQIKGKSNCVTMPAIPPKVLAPGMYAIDVEPIPPHNRNNREVHLDYLRHLKESEATLYEIVEEARVKSPLDTSLASTCLYTKHSQELLEYAIGTCPKDFKKRDKQIASTSATRKKQVTFMAPCDTSTNNTHSHVKQHNMNKTNEHVILSTGVKGPTDRPLVFRLRLFKTYDRDRSRLMNFVKRFFGIVRFGDDHFGAIIGYGDYMIGDSVISRVYYVEGLGYNLFSVGQFCDSDLEVAFRKHLCFVRDVNGVDLIKDNGTKFINQVLTEYDESVGIFHQKSVLRTPQQNGIVERRNRTLVEAARTMLIFSKAPMFLWAEAVAIACYTQNRSLIHTRHNKTPYELVHDKKPDLKFLCVFGALCYPTNDSEDLGKLRPTADIGIFVGYAPSRNGYRIYNKRTRKIIEIIHVTFDELTEHMATVQLSTGPAPTFLTPGQINPPRVERPVPSATTVQVPVILAGSPSSTTIDQDAPSISYS